VHVGNDSLQTRVFAIEGPNMADADPEPTARVPALWQPITGTHAKLIRLELRPVQRQSLVSWFVLTAGHGRFRRFKTCSRVSPVAERLVSRSAATT
jgi:hypothetical protein